MSATEKTDPRQVWDQVYLRENSNVINDDAMGLFLAYCLKDTLQSIGISPIRSAIEVGAGSGRTSRCLGEFGADIGILDISQEALKLANQMNSGLPQKPQFYCLDFFNLNPESINRTYHVVWNAGVLEHFTPSEQKQIINNMLGVSDSDGVAVMFTPYSRSLFYRLGKWILETFRSFPYGIEVPLATLEPVLPNNAQLIMAEKSVGIVILLFNGFKAFSLIPGMKTIGLALHRSNSRLWVLILNQAPLRRLVFRFDQLFSKLLGGYLLMTICRRKITT